MIDPLTWGVAAIAVFSFQRVGWPVRVLGAVVANVAAALVIYYVVAWRYGPLNSVALQLSALATMVWFSVFEISRRLKFKRPRASPPIPNPQHSGQSTEVTSEPPHPASESAQEWGLGYSGSMKDGSDREGHNVSPSAQEHSTEGPADPARPIPDATLQSAAHSRDRRRTNDSKQLLLLAEAGDAQAQFELGQMYAMGEGILQDYVLAHMWLNLAASQGAEGAAEMRNSLGERMVGAEIAEAQRLARNWSAATGSALSGLPKTGPLPSA